MAAPLIYTRGAFSPQNILLTKLLQKYHTLTFLTTVIRIRQIFAHFQPIGIITKIIVIQL